MNNHTLIYPFSTPFMIVDFDETPIINWKKGDYVLWKNDTPHMAANLGKENRYTMQVTGIIGND